MAKNRIILAIALLAVCAAGARAGMTGKKIAASRVDSKIVLDGRLDEDAWNSAQVISDFQQYDPSEGASPTEETLVRVLYDDDALYIGVDCRDSDPNGIVQQLTRRDRTVQSDRFTVWIDSYHDRQTAFLFSGSVSGVQSDGMLSSDGVVYDVQWDAVWDFHSAQTPNGWTAEFRIPFSALRFTASDSDYIWGINFRRYIARKNETDEWAMLPRNLTPPGTISSVSRMGELEGLRGIRPPLHLEVLPYTSGKESFLSEPSPVPVQKQFNADAGVDLKYGITNNFTLDMAVNPDFGQVEVDQAVLNLTVFETFYPEKRPFFLEGSQIFQFGQMFDNTQLQLFYSRRIGKKPGTPAPQPGYFFEQDPATTSILGAAKFTGRSSSGLSVGAFSALTDQEEGIQDSSGHRLPSQVLEPRASYDLVRLKQDIFDNSYIGFMATDVSKNGLYPALNGGFDWNLRLDNNTYAIDGYIAGSDTTSMDGGHSTGAAGRLGIGKIQGDHWLGYSFYDFSTYQFNVDRMGFYSQPREHGGYTEVTYKNDFAAAPILRYAVNVETDYRTDWDGFATKRLLEFNPTVEFVNFWSVTLDAVHNFHAYDDAQRGINGLFLRPLTEDVSLTLQTDPRSSFVLAAVESYESTALGAGTSATTLQGTLRPATWMEFDPTISYVRTRNQLAWAIPLYTPDGNNLFGDRDIDEFNFSLSGTVTFTNTLSAQFFTQIFLAKAQYENFTELESPTTLSPYDWYANPTDPSPDFDQQTLNANVVLRWEYLPGSTIYLVWQQARFADDGVYAHSLGTNFAQAFKIPMDNIVLAKITYWWSL